MKKIRSILFILFFVLSFLPCKAASTSGGLTELRAAIGAAGTNDFTANVDIPVATSALGTMNVGAVGLTINGASHDLNGGSLAGVAVRAGQTLTISNFGTALNGDGTVAKSINSFSSATGGGFIYSNGAVSASSNVIYNNAISRTVDGANLSLYGGAIDEVPTTLSDSSGSVVTPLSIDNNKFFKNTISATNTTTSINSNSSLQAYGGAIYSAVTESGAGAEADVSITGNTFGSIVTGYGNSVTSSSHIIMATNSYRVSSNACGGAIYTSGTASGAGTKFTANINNSNIFVKNTASASNDSTNPYPGTTNPGTAASNAYGGAISSSMTASGSNSQATLNINNSNTFTSNSASTTNSSNTSGAASGGYTYSYSLGGAVYNTSTISNSGSTVAVNINNANVFKSNFVNAGNTSRTGTGNNYSYAEGGAIYNYVAVSADNVTANGISLSIAGNTFGGTFAEGNTATSSVSDASSTSSGALYAYSYGGAIYNEFIAGSTLRNSTTNIIDINSNYFESNSLSSTVSSTTTGAKVSTAIGGAIYNKVTLSGTSANSSLTTNIKGNNFGVSSTTGNIVNSYNTSTTSTGSASASSSTAQGGALYNYVSLADGNSATINIGRTAVDDTSTSDNNFHYNSASASNTSTTDTGNITSAVYGGAIDNELYLSGTATNTTNIKYNLFTHNTAITTNGGTTASTATTSPGSSSSISYGGAIYNYTSLSNNSSNTTNIKYSDFTSNSANATNSGTSNSTGYTFSSAFGGAIYNNLSGASTSPDSSSNTINIENGIFTGNSVSSTNSSTATNGRSYAYAMGGAIYSVYTGATSGTNSNTINIKNNTFGGDLPEDGNTAFSTNSSPSTSVAASSAYGGAIYNKSILSTGTNSNTINIENNTFKNNSASATNTSSSSNKSTASYGGTVYHSLSATGTGVNTNTVNITDNIFDTNTANYGGAVYNDIIQSGTGTNTNIIRVRGTADTTSKFLNNVSGSSGGAVYNNISASAPASVGSYVEVDIDKTTFSLNNSALGGAFTNNISSTTNGIINSIENISNSTFSSNYSTNRGGAIYNPIAATFSTTNATNYTGSVTSAVTIDNTKIQNNYISLSIAGASSAYGGGVANSITTTASATSTGSASANTIASNTIQNGSIISGNHVDATSTDAVTASTADARGGGIYNSFLSTAPATSSGVTSATQTITNSIQGSTFGGDLASDGNRAVASSQSTTTAYGGALYNLSSGSATQTVNNTASGYSDLTTTIGNSTFKNNYASATSTGSLSNSTATAQGGAIYNTSIAVSKATASATMTITNDSSHSFDSNHAYAESANKTAKAQGGAIYNVIDTTSTGTATANLTVQSKFQNNYVEAKAQGTSSSVSATAQGGAIYNGTSTTATLSGSTFTGNYVKATGTGSSSYANGQGGAIYNAGTMTLNSSTSFEGNGVKNYGSTDLGNPATVVTNQGGAIYNSGTISTIDGSTFTSNKASNTGGAIYNSGTISTIDASTFTSNTVSNYGGAIYNNGSSKLTINNSIFTGNSANLEGGGIYNFTNCELAVNNSTFTENNAGSRAGAINNSNGILTVSGSTFTNNYADSGGAIYNYINNNNTFTVSTSTFTGNGINTQGTVTTDDDVVTTVNGGAIYNENGKLTVSNSTFTGNKATDYGGAIYNSGTLNIIDDNKTTSFTGNQAGGTSNALYLAGGIVNLNASAAGLITFGDKITSSAIGNAININKTDLGFVSGGEVIFNNTVSDSSINLYSGTLTLGATGSALTTTYLSNVNLSLNAGILNLQNNLTTDVLNLNNFTVNALSSLKFDANMSTGVSDRINVAGAATGTLNLNNLHIVTDGTASSLTLVSGTNISGLTLSNFTAYSTYYKYILTGSTNGTYAVARDWADGLNSAVACDNTTPRSFSATSDTTVSGDLGAMGTAGSTLSVYGNNRNINGNNHAGVSVASGQTLNISGVGSLDEDGSVNKSWNGSNSTNGGAVNNAGALSVDTSVFSGNTATTNGGAINSSNSATVTGSTFKSNQAYDGGAISNSGTITVTNTSFGNNNSTNFGGAVYSAGIANISNSSFTNNTASTAGGAVVNESGTLAISSSTFTGNSSPVGGAMANGGILNIYNSSFTNNTASNVGGAIYSTDGTLNLIVDGGNIDFTGNTATSAGNDVYLDNGSTLNLNTKLGNTITFNGGIATSDINTKINVNGTTANDASIISGAPTTGEVIFNNTVLNATVSLYNGKLSLGKTGPVPSGGYFSSVNFNLLGGVLNLQNNNPSDLLTINNFNSTASGSLNIDANLLTGENDKITVLGTASGTLKIGDLHIVQESSSSAFAMTLFTDNNSPTLTAFNTYTTGYKYHFAPSATTSGVYNVTKSSTSGINYAIEDDTSPRSFSATGNTSAEHTLGDMGGAGSTLSIYGNQNNINGLGYGGVNVAAGQTLNVSGVGEIKDDPTQNTAFNGFSSVNGGVINNSGTVNVSQSVLYNNTASNFGGFLKNSGTAAVSNSVFANNTAGVSGGAIYNTGTANVLNSSFTNNTASNLGGAIYNSGTLNLIADNGNVTFSGNTDSSGSNDIYLASGSTLNLNVGNGGNLTFGGKINSAGSSDININKSGILEPDGTTTAPTDGTLYVNKQISNSNISLYNGTLAVGNESYLNGNNLSLNGGSLNLINGSAGTISLGNLNLANGTTTNLGIDVNLANSTADRISASTYSGTGTINLNRINLLTDRSSAASIPIIDSAVAGSVTTNITSGYGPIFKYNLAYSPSTGMLAASPVSNGNYTDYNPSLLSKPVSAMAGTYLNQVSTYNEALSRAEVFMTLPQTERLLMRYGNRYANIGGSDVQPEVFSPTFLPEDKGGLWVKQYTSFENVPLINGPNVSSVGYGVLIGGDTPLTRLRHGFDGYITTYVGYNGSHQNYNNVGVNQNGGVVGITGTVYRGNFFAALTATVGESSGNASNSFGNDYFNTLIAGAALKTGYNIEMLKGKLIFQPSILAAYTYATTFDYQTASGVNITSQPLNAVQIAPGIKLIGNFKNGWQPYLATNMVFNLMDVQKFYANDVQLPQMSIAPYVEYGFGLQRRWGGRFTGFGQCMFRGGGRNGVAFQFGFRYALGK